MSGQTPNREQRIDSPSPAGVVDRNAMIELRQARERWSDEAAAAPTVRVAEVDEPFEFAVLALPSFDLTTSIAVRDRAAYEDRKLRIEQMAGRADSLLARVRAEVAEIESPEPVEPAIDLRDDTMVVIELSDTDAAAATFEPTGAQSMQDVVAAIRRLSELRDAGLITTSEFDERMTDLLAQV